MTSYLSPTDDELLALIGGQQLDAWHSLCAMIDGLYDMDRAWHSGGKKWTHEYKYCRGGKTLCALYARKDCSGFMLIFGHDERSRFEAERDKYSAAVCACYDEAASYHDGKWMMFPLDTALFDDYRALLAIKRSPNRK